MQTRNDAELLRDYAVSRSEAAFGEIVRRYADVVYSAALRQVGDAEAARDVAQMVFADLARKAGALPASTLLVGWLHRGARLAALEQLRKDQRRQQRERQAMESLDTAPETPDDWNGVRPVLDEAIASLGHEDRDALLLRFFKNESLSAVGTALGVSEDAAQKRVSRALDKLREFLAGRGIKTTTAALSAALVANAVQSAPAGFAAAAATGALAEAAAAAGSTAPVLKLLTFTKMKTALLLVALSGGLAGLTLLQVHSQRELREARSLAAQRAEDADALRAARDLLAAQSNQVERLRRDAQDVVRLRGNVTRLQSDLARLRSSLAATPSGTAANMETNSRPEPPQVQVNIKAKFLSLPARTISSSATEFLPFLARPASPSATGILTEPQFATFLRALEEMDGVRQIYQAQVTTLSGRQAQLQVSSDEGTSSGHRLLLDVLPVYATNSAAISLNVAIATEGMVDLPAGEAPPDMPAPVRVRDARSLTVSNAVTLWDGQTLVLGRAISSGEKWLGGDEAEPRQLLILLTTTLIDSAGNRLANTEDSSPTPASASGPGAMGRDPIFPGVAQ